MDNWQLLEIEIGHDSESYQGRLLLSIKALMIVAIMRKPNLIIVLLPKGLKGVFLVSKTCSGGVKLWTSKTLIICNSLFPTSHYYWCLWDFHFTRFKVLLFSLSALIKIVVILSGCLSGFQLTRHNCVSSKVTVYVQGVFPVDRVNLYKIEGYKMGYKNMLIILQMFKSTNFCVSDMRRSKSPLWIEGPAQKVVNFSVISRQPRP